ncbi:hypothetical protein T459_16128 [Capsicum annuum]|uniref:Uncharacterized protein n=1 Tax=Capsicum annuum TaxID=4072 RepID=A0A2G2Z7U6_CAPAN|nr:hypothetical protein T459_16128 [Capsicum annuum]
MGLSPSLAPPSKGLEPGQPLKMLLQTTIRLTELPDSMAGLFLIRSLLLRESLSKGLLGHGFTVPIRTGNQNQASSYPSIPHEISIHIELILGHLCYLLIDVPPQSNSQPDNVFHPNWPSEFPLFVPVMSWLFDVRGRPLKEPFPVHPQPTRDDPLPPQSISSSPSIADGFGTGTPMPKPQSQSFSRSCESILPTSLAYIIPSTKGCLPWRPDAVMSMTRCGQNSVLRITMGHWECIRYHAIYGALLAAGPYLQLS